MQDVDLLIIGNGLVAKTLALAAAARGFSSLRFANAGEDDRAYADDPRSYAITGNNLRALTDIDVRPDALAVHGLVLQFGQTFTSDARRFENSQSFMHMVDHRDLSVTLDDELAKQDRAGRVVRAADMCPQLGEYFAQMGTVARAPLLLIAEGRESPSAIRLGFNYERHAYDQSAIVAKLETQYPTLQTAKQLFTRFGPIGVLPAGEHMVSIVWSVDNDRARSLIALAPDQLTAVLAAHVGNETGALSLLSKPAAFALNDIHATRLHNGRAVLLGDAAHILHPMAGQGLNLGLRDCWALIDLLVEARSLGQDLGGAMVTNAYRAARRADIDRLVLLTRSLDQLRKVPMLGVANRLMPKVLGQGWIDRIVALIDPADG